MIFTRVEPLYFKLESTAEHGYKPNHPPIAAVDMYAENSGAKFCSKLLNLSKVVSQLMEQALFLLLSAATDKKLSVLIKHCGPDKP
jgi:hypothetical protein